MRHVRLVFGLSLAMFAAVAMVEAQGKPSTVPVGPPSTPVEGPTAPPEDAPDSLTGWLCSILPVPYLCD